MLLQHVPSEESHPHTILNSLLSLRFLSHISFTQLPRCYICIDSTQPPLLSLSQNFCSPSPDSEFPCLLIFLSIRQAQHRQSLPTQAAWGYFQARQWFCCHIFCNFFPSLLGVLSISMIFFFFMFIDSFCLYHNIHLLSSSASPHYHIWIIFLPFWGHSQPILNHHLLCIIKFQLSLSMQEGVRQPEDWRAVSYHV